MLFQTDTHTHTHSCTHTHLLFCANWTNCSVPGNLPYKAPPISLSPLDIMRLLKEEEEGEEGEGGRGGVRKGRQEGGRKEGRREGRRKGVHNIFNTADLLFKHTHAQWQAQWHTHAHTRTHTHAGTHTGKKKIFLTPYSQLHNNQSKNSKQNISLHS